MEFQAVLMAAGTGSRMRDMTSSIPKCLLPVGNVPLILCSLNILKRAGIHEVIVIVRENEKAKIQSAVENKLEMKLDFVTVPKNEDWGTADSLRHVKEKIKSDILVLSCDVVSDIDLQKMANFHHSKSSSLTVLLVPALDSLKELDMPGYKKKCKQERDIIGMDPTSRLIFINSEADFESGVPFKISILKRYPQIKVHSNLIDAHVYMIKKKLLLSILSNEHISTLKGEFLPAAVKEQFTKKSDLSKQETLDMSRIESSDTFEKELSDLKNLSLELSSSRNQDVNSKSSEAKGISCFSYVDKESFCTRVNTLVAYMDINQKISKHFITVTGLQPKAHQYQRSQVEADSVVGENCELLAKASVKHSSVGSNSFLGEKVKIMNSIIMDHVRIEDECSIQGSIICSNVIVEKKCELKNSIVGPEQTVIESSKLLNEILQGADKLMEI